MKLISRANAIIDVRAVVVKLLHTVVAVLAMRRQRRSPYQASTTKTALVDSRNLWIDLLFVLFDLLLPHYQSHSVVLVVLKNNSRVCECRSHKLYTKEEPNHEREENKKSVLRPSKNWSHLCQHNVVREALDSHESIEDESMLADGVSH